MLYESLSVSRSSLSSSIGSTSEDRRDCEALPRLPSRAILMHFRMFFSFEDLVCLGIGNFGQFVNTAAIASTIATKDHKRIKQCFFAFSFLFVVVSAKEKRLKNLTAAKTVQFFSGGIHTCR